MDSTGTEQGPLADYCEHDDKNFCSYSLRGTITRVFEAREPGIVMAQSFVSERHSHTSTSTTNGSLVVLSQYERYSYRSSGSTPLTFAII
jgi:hypothetical protein